MYFLINSCLLFANTISKNPIFLYRNLQEMNALYRLRLETLFQITERLITIKQLGFSYMNAIRGFKHAGSPSNMAQFYRKDAPGQGIHKHKPVQATQLIE